MGYFADNIIIALEAVMPLDESRDEKTQNSRIAKKVHSEYIHHPRATNDKYADYTDRLAKTIGEKEMKKADDLYNEKEVPAAKRNKFKLNAGVKEFADDAYDDTGYTDKEKKLRHKTQSAIDALDRHERRHGKSLKEAFDSLYEED